MIRFVKFILIVFSIFFTSCTNDLAPKTTDFNFSFTLPQYDVNPRSSTESTSNQISDLQKWIINAKVETSEKVLQNITQEGTSGQTITIHFENIQVSQNVRIDIELTPKGEEKPSYKGTSEWFITKKGSNKIHITLKKIQYEIIPDDDNDTGTDDKPEIIIDAAIPQIIKQPENVIEIVTENSGEPISMPLSVTAQSTDNGTLSFVWQEKNVDNIWKNLSIDTSDATTKSSIMVDVYKGESRTFKCIITNTNDSVNGNKTATIETNEATIAYVKGDLTSITATYQSDEYQILGQDFDYTKVTITETYTKDNQQTTVNVAADSSRYTISPKNDENVIGYVPYTVTYNEATTILLTSEIRVPVKYQLKASDFAITSSTSSDYDEINTIDNPKKIAQFTGNTVLTVGSASEASSVPSLIYATENSDNATDYNIMENLQSVWKKTINNQTTDFTDTKADNSIAGTYIYSNTLTVPTDDTWVIGESIQLDYYIQVYPWEIAFKTSDGNTVDLTNLTGNTEYTLSATNDADENPSVIFTSSNTNFTITDTTLTTPTPTTSDQTATITAIIGDKEIGTLQVTVKKVEPLGSSMANPFTNWTDLKAYLEMTSDAATDIYVQGPLDATEAATIHRPVTIIPVGNVTITRTAENTNYMFDINKNLTLQGSENNQFILQGNSDTVSSQLINCTTSNVELNLQYCTLQNANCGNSNYASAIFVENDEEESVLINMTNCKIKHNIGTPITIEATVIINLENCTFSNNTATTKASVIYIDSSDGNEDIITINNCNFANNTNISSKCGYLTLEDSNQISIINSDFDSCTTGYNIYISTSKSLTLDGQISIPKIYFNNDEEGRLAINVGTNLSLKDSLIPLTLYALYYREVGDINNDCIFFNLENGETLPDGVFDLADSSYVLNSDGTITEANSGGSGGTTVLDGTQVTNETELLSAIESATDVIIIANNITITECIDISNPVQIAANTDVTITSNLVSDYMFYLYSNLTLGGGSGTLTITGPNHEIALIGTNSATKTITINNGVKFTNCSYYCLSLTGKDTLEINGGEFSSNTMAPIAIASSNTSAVINMSGGKIENNSATNIAAGIIVNNGTFNITGGTLQNNILNETDSGASIYVSTYGNATIEQTNTTLSKNAHYKKAIINGIEQ